MRRLWVLLLVGACHTQAAEKSVPKLPEGAVRFETPRGPWVVRVEIANSDADRTRGLMYRRQLPPDRGMVFIFPTTEEHGFWMHDTLIALDLNDETDWTPTREERAAAVIAERLLANGAKSSLDKSAPDQASLNKLRGIFEHI